MSKNLSNDLDVLSVYIKMPFDRPSLLGVSS